MSHICAQIGCDNHAYKEQSKCILHCEKSEYSVDFHKIGFLKSFNDELIIYIAKQLSQYHSEDVALPYEDLINYFSKGINEIAESNREILLENIKSHPVVFNNIFFPERKSIDSFDYINVLQKLGGIHFNYCEFKVGWFDLLDSEIFFQDCIFHNQWSLNNFKVLKNVDDIVYQCCTFKNGVISSAEDGKFALEATQFKDCNFKSIRLEDTIFKQKIFKNDLAFGGEIESVNILDCIFEDKFVLTRHTIHNFKLQNIVFRDEFEFMHNIDVDYFVDNTRFEKQVYCYKTFFSNFWIQDSIFYDFVGFERCQFNSRASYETAYFQDVTFLSFLNFRDAQFQSGLDMRGANLKEYPNFLGAYIEPKNTDKETFRIIKHSFDKVGNTTEANKYFAHEMKKERKEVSWSENPEKKIILGFNHFVSDFGQSYFLPLFWIFVLVVSHFFISMAMDKYQTPDFIDFLNVIVRNITPFKRFLSEGKEFVSLIFLIGYSTLIYQFIVAVKRITKR